MYAYVRLCGFPYCTILWYLSGLMFDVYGHGDPKFGFVNQWARQNEFGLVTPFLLWYLIS